MKLSVFFNYLSVLFLLSFVHASEQFSEEKNPQKRSWSERDPVIEGSDDETESYEEMNLKGPKDVGGMATTYRMTPTSIIPVGNHLECITKIDCTGIPLNKFPMALLAATYLLELNLQGTGLKQYPNELSKFFLRSLNLSGNGLRQVPPIVCQIKSIKILKLSANKITALPSEFEQLSLIELSCDANKLKTFPLAILKMTALEFLDLSGNQIPHIPYGFLYLKNISAFHIGTPTNKLSINDKIYKKNASNICNFSFMGEGPIVNLRRNIVWLFKQ